MINVLLLSLNVGVPRAMLSPDGTPFTSSIGRRAAEAPLRLAAGGFTGDACQWSGHHSANMAVNAMGAEQYAMIEEWAGRAFPRPGFGENLSLAGWPDEIAAPGDVLRIGDAVVRITQPREPCGNLVRFHGLPGIVKAMRDLPATGYYLSVLEEGIVAPGSDVRVVERGLAEWTIARLNAAMFAELADRDQVAAVRALPHLSPEWKDSLAAQAAKLKPK